MKNTKVIILPITCDYTHDCCRAITNTFCELKKCPDPDCSIEGKEICSTCGGNIQDLFNYHGNE